MKNLEKNWLEWIVFAVSLVLVVSTLGYLIYDGATFGMHRPELSWHWGHRSRN